MRETLNVLLKYEQDIIAVEPRIGTLLAEPPPPPHPFDGDA